MPACRSSHSARAATSATSRSSMGAVSAAPNGQRTGSPFLIARDHQGIVFEAKIPGRMIVDASPESAIKRSRSAWSFAAGLGCWKKGWRV